MNRIFISLLLALTLSACGEEVTKVYRDDGTLEIKKVGGLGDSRTIHYRRDGTKEWGEEFTQDRGLQQKKVQFFRADETKEREEVYRVKYSGRGVIWRIYYYFT